MKRAMVKSKTRVDKKPPVRQSRAKRSTQVDDFDLDADLQARVEGPRRKNWSTLDIRPLRPANEKQADAISNWVQGGNLALLGSTGTGKTALAVYLSATSMLRKDEDIDKIIIIRSAVQARDLGFLPGDLAEKLAAYEQPYVDAFATLFGRAATYNDMKEAGKITFLSTSFLRGVTFDNAVIIFDEAQNCTFNELNSTLSRIGHGSRVLILGDTRQCDLKNPSENGLAAFREIVKDINNFPVIEFDRHDIVRSGFVKSWIIASEDYFDRVTPKRLSGPRLVSNL